MASESSDRNEPEKTSVHNWLVSKMFEVVPFNSNQRVLDLHVGNGRYTTSISTKVKSIEAFHSKEDSLNELRQAIKTHDVRNINVHPAVTSYCQLPFEKETFDLVSCRTAIHNFDDIASVFREIHRVLTPDGILSISEPFVSETVKGVWAPIARIVQKHYGFPTYLGLTELLSDAGFLVDKIVPYKAPRSLDEYVIARSPEISEIIRRIMLEEVDLRKELCPMYLQTPEELSVLKRYGIMKPEPGWRLWYDLAEVIARKKPTSGIRTKAVESSFTKELYRGEDRKQIEVSEIVPHAFELIANHLHHEDTALDLACGQGTGTLLFANKVKQVHAIDPRAIAVEGVRGLLAKHGITNVEVHDPVSVTEPTPFSDGMFNAAALLLGTALYPDFKSLLKEVGRVLKTGGRCVILCAVFSDYLRPVWLTIARLALQPVLSYFTYHDIMDAFDSSELEIEEMRPFYGNRHLSEFLVKIQDLDLRENLKKSILDDSALRREMHFREEEDDWVFSFNTLEILAKRK